MRTQDLTVGEREHGRFDDSVRPKLGSLRATRVSKGYCSRNEEGRFGVDLTVRTRKRDLVRDARDDHAFRGQARFVETLRRIEEDGAADARPHLTHYVCRKPEAVGAGAAVTRALESKVGATRFATTENMS